MAYELDPLELLRAELKENDYESIIKTINKITIIGLALGPDRTRKELLPFLKDYAEVDNDEAQAAVAAQLGDFVPLVGGSEHGSLLLPLLENLCGMEETAIRDAAVQSLNKIIPQLPPAETAQKVFPMIKRLASGDWFYSRMSAAGVCGVTYPVVPDEAQREILAIFNNLCNDDTPMVRKAAYQCLGPTAINMQKDRIKEEMIPLVQGLSQDDLDSMRIFTIEACAVIAQVFDDSETDQYIIPAVINMHDDPSWRIRQHYCKTIDKLTKNVGPDLSGSKLLPGFVKLLHDHESNVRISAAQVMHLVAANCSQVSLQQFLAPAFEDLVGDENDKVRVAFASACVHMCEVFGAEQSQKFLLPFIQTLAKDAQSDVRNAIISNIHLLAKTMGPQIVDQSILPILTDLSKDLKWRVRLEVTGKISFVARELASSTGIDACESKLMTMLVNGLTDHVYSIREKACDQVAELTEYLGITWSTVKLFPVALAVFEKSTNYLHRMTSLIIVKQVLKRKVISGSDAEKLFLPLVIAACRDPVANVRFAAAKTMRVLVPLIDKTAVDTQAVPVLSALTKDSDVDVKFFAEEALKLCV